MRKVKFVLVLVLLALLLSVGSGVVMADEPLPPDVDQALLNDLEEALFDYSRALSTGQIAQKRRYTPAMQSLIRERREFYEEYFEVGLHSTLEGISSEFVFEPDNAMSTVDPSAVPSNDHPMVVVEPDVEIVLISKARLSVKVAEKVTLCGRYNTSPEEHPLVLAGRWALSRTDDEAVKQGLKRYIQDVREDTRESFEEGFETVLIVRHSLIVAGTQDGLQIVRDSFTDQAEGIPGMDNVLWVDGQHVRNKPDFTEMPSYRRYAMSTEELGEKLLQRFTIEYGESTKPLATRGTYDRWAAKDYINSWTSNASSLCHRWWEWWMPDVNEDRSKWNPDYHKYRCKDCANYVSQALKSGGHTTTGTWKPYEHAWTVAPDLYDWLKDSGRGVDESCTIAWEGDIAFVEEGDQLTHVVMVTGSGRDTYSGHSYDRLNRSWDPSLTKCMWILTSY